MKTCPSCKQELPLSAFNKNKARPDGLGGNCRECMKVYRKSYYQANRNKVIESVITRRKTLKLEYVEALKLYLSEHPCVDCGNTDIRVLEFDHKDDVTKVLGISTMLLGGYTWETIAKEIEKCDVRCANCHRIRTHTQFKTFRSDWL